jgi:hypothetical protein
LVIVHSTPQVQTGVEQPIVEVPQAADDIPVDQVVQEFPRTFEQRVEPHTSQEDGGTTLRRFTRPKRSTIPNDYVVYLQESDYNIGAENDPESFSQAMSCKESELWYDTMKEEMNSIKSNEFGILLSCLMVQKPLDVNGSLRQRKTHSLLHIVKIPTFYLRRYGQNCPYCRKIEEIYKKK